MKIFKNIGLLLLFFSLGSCITQKEVRYLQSSENLNIDQEGLIPYNKQDYRITKNDIFNLNIVTTPKGDAAQFYSRFNTSGGENVAMNANRGNVNTQFNNSIGGSGGLISTGNVGFYFDGIKVDSKGDIYVLGIGYLKAEGRHIEDLRKEIQEKVNENFQKDKTDVRLNLDGISYYILGDVESTGLTGMKISYTQSLNIMEAIAANGGLNRTIDRKNIILQRKYPEGMKRVRLDLTREDLMNSPYFWLQNGDMIYLNTRGKSLQGFGKDPVQTLTTGVSLITTVLSIYLLISNLNK